MKKSSSLLSPSELEALRQRYQRLTHRLAHLPWVCQGSVIHIPPGAYRWTRKVNKKTITLALSKDQASLIMEAILNHRTLETILKEMRELSEKALLGSVPGIQKRVTPKRPKPALS